jgi:hypothetical protein
MTQAELGLKFREPMHALDAAALRGLHLVSFSPSHTAMCSFVSRTKSISRCFGSGHREKHQNRLLLIDAAEVKQIAVLHKAQEPSAFVGSTSFACRMTSDSRRQFGSKTSTIFNKQVGGGRLVTH